MGLSPDYRNRFEKERISLYETTYEGPLPPNFDKYRQFLGSVVNETQLGITAMNYAILFFSADIQQYSIGNMVSLLQASENATLSLYTQGTRRIDGINPISEWCDLRQSIEAITTDINGIIEPAMGKIVKKLQALQHSIAPGDHSTKTIALS